MALVVLLTSGGIDSCLLASVASQNHQLAMLHIAYNQQAANLEKEAFEKMVKYFKPKYAMIAKLDHFKQMGGCSLVDPKLPIEAISEIGSQRMQSWLAFGLPTFWSVAASWAMTINAQAIYCGGSEDYGLPVPGYAKIEPSIDREMIQLFNCMLQKVALPDRKIALELPFLTMKRMEMIQLARQLKSPLELAWSCYKPGPAPCRQCYKCQIRQQGFLACNQKDPRFPV
jgi:7-cyano-7-deazaguanine synthase